MNGHRALIGLVAICQIVVAAGHAFAQTSGMKVGAASGQVAGSENRGLRSNRAEGSSRVSVAVFDDRAPDGKTPQDRFRDQLERRLTKRIDEVGQMFDLTGQQRQKLRLAGHGDMKRLLEAIEDSRRAFELAKGNDDKMREASRHARELDALMNFDLFEFGSLFDKTLRKMFEEKKLRRKSPVQKSSPVEV